MTSRAEYTPSPIEKAIDSVIDNISDSATAHYMKNGPPMPEEKFRELLAHVLHNMSINDWRRRLGLPLEPEEEEKR